MKYDVLVIGAGAIGCAIARRLTLNHPEYRIAVLEKLPSEGLLTSSRNSGVLHSGINLNPLLLKAKLTQIGVKLAVSYAKEREIPLLQCGMIIAVPWSALRGGIIRETGSFLRLLQAGRERGIRFEFLGPRALRKKEPHLSALGGIFVPGVWVIDSSRFVSALKEDAEARGAEFFFNAPVSRIQAHARGYEVVAGDMSFSAGIVINAAGLYADEVARMAGFPNYTIYPWRGEYYEVIGERSAIARHLIYPVMRRGAPTKGVHFGPRPDGRLFIGPNARPVPSKEWYEEDKTPVSAFAEAAQKFFPEIEEKDLVWSHSGIRAKLTNDPGESDFIIRRDGAYPPFINLIGIESPGLSAAMAIASYVEQMLFDSFFELS